MPVVQYPFIDIAVHERVKDHFARGEAIVLFSLDLEDVLWANGAGAQLFGKAFVYDLIEEGPARTDVTFRQLAASSAQLRAPDASLQFLIRVASGFQRVPVQAVVERITLPGQVDAILFASPVSNAALKPSVIARSMLEGFDDPDTHMAVLGAGGEVIASSPSFSAIGLTPATARTLVGMVGNQPDRLVKRPVPTGKGTLPAAIGKVSEEPPLHLLFAVETILGNMGPATGFPEEEANAAPSAEDFAPASGAQDLQVTATEDGATLASGGEEPLAADVAPSDEVPLAADMPFIEDLAATGSFEDETADEAGGEQDEHTSEADDTSEQIAEADNAPQPEQAVDTLAADEDDGGNDVTPEASLAPEIAGEPVAAVEPDSTEVAEAGLATSITEPEATGSEPAFVFNPAARPTRFVWKVDADGQFSEISPELAVAVGPHAAALAGQAFSEIADRLHLDPDGKIAELLGKRDTWSGKTIYWPIEGTALRAPVDLAALPTYRRNREFDGFRGFGIVRISDAIEDDDAIGMTLVPNHDEPDVHPADEENAVAADEQPDSALEVAPETNADDAVADQSDTTSDAAEQDQAEPEALADALDLGHPGVPVADGPDLGEEAAADAAEDVLDVPPPSIDLLDEELPVFRPVDTPQRQPTDKIIKLDERRLRSRDVLSPGEQEAFREIARQLEPFRRSDEDETAAADEVSGETLSGAEPEDATGGIELPPSAAWDIPSAADAGEGSDEPTAEREETDEPLALEPASSASESEQLEILASFIPARTAMAGGLTGEVIDEIPVALLIHAGDRLIHANAEFLRLSGYGSLADLEAVGGLDSLLHHKDLEDMPDHSGGLSLVRADDELIPVTARLQSVRWEDNNALLLALIPSGLRPPEVQAAPEHDVDEDRLLSRIDDLQVEVDELRSILETATDGVVILGNEGEIRSMNRSASALFDYDEAETRGKPFVMLFAHESHRAVADYLSGMTGHGVASVLNDGREVIGREASGGFIPLFMTIGKLSASNGFCAVIRDITQWKRSEEDLKSAKRAAETANAHKTDFLARVSHEIRTPLNAIIGFSDMMAIEHFGPIGHPRYVEYANDIARSGRLVLDIVNDLLDISKIEAGEMDLEFTAVELNEAVSEAVSLVQPQAHTQRVIIRTAFSDAVPDVVADLRSVKQIVLNILANAIRFTQAGGQIVVSTAYEPSGSVVLRIRDTGVGMTRAELEQAMKPFRQVTAGAGARKRGDGTGLGLPLTKAMVDANRANFTIHSAPNEGTLVEITFPSPRVLAN